MKRVIKNPRRQLSEFYTKTQGLTGRHLRKAMRYDLKQIARKDEYPPFLYQRWSVEPGMRGDNIHRISGRILFDCMEEGFGYWSARDLCQPYRPSKGIKGPTPSA